LWANGALFEKPTFWWDLKTSGELLGSHKKEINTAHEETERDVVNTAIMQTRSKISGT
jgi:hypothetical protein